MGRPKVYAEGTRPLQTRLPTADVRLIELRCVQAGIRPSRWLRRAAIEQLLREGVAPDEIEALVSGEQPWREVPTP